MVIRSVCLSVCILKKLCIESGSYVHTRFTCVFSVLPKYDSDLDQDRVQKTRKTCRGVNKCRQIKGQEDINQLKDERTR